MTKNLAFRNTLERELCSLDSENSFQFESINCFLRLKKTITVYFSQFLVFSQNQVTFKELITVTIFKSAFFVYSFKSISFLFIHFSVAQSTPGNNWMVTPERRRPHPPYVSLQCKDSEAVEGTIECLETDSICLVKRIGMCMHFSS